MKKLYFKIVLAILTIVLLGGGVFYYEKYFKNKYQNQSNGVVQKASDFSKVNNDQTTKEKVIIFQKSDQGNEIISYDLTSKESKTIYSDKDAELKINLLGGFAYLKGEILVYAGDDSVGKLETIKINDGSTNVVRELFAKPNVLIISPDGQIISYGQINNIDNKTIIYQMSRDGSNLRQITASENKITNLSFDNNASHIVYTEISLDNKSDIISLDLSSLNKDQLYSSSNQILSLNWLASGKIIFSEGLNNQIKTGRAMVMNADGSSVKKIFETKKDFPYSVTASSDFNTTAFILASYKDKFENLISGDSDFIKVGDESINKIGNGNYIIGWMQ